MEKLKKVTNDTTIKDIRNLFRREKQNKEIKDRIILDNRGLFEHGDMRNIFRLKENNKVLKEQ